MALNRPSFVTFDQCFYMGRLGNIVRLDRDVLAFYQDTRDVPKDLDVKVLDIE